MSDKKNSTSSSSHDQTKPKEEFGLTGITTGPSGEYLADTGASALGTSGGSGEMGNEKSKIDRSMDGLGPATSTTASLPAVSTD